MSFVTITNFIASVRASLSSGLKSFAVLPAAMVLGEAYLAGGFQP